MSKLNAAWMVVLLSISIAGAAQRVSSPLPGPAFPATPASIGGSNLPFQPIGVSDLLRITVANSPELSQSFRVDKNGNLNLPLLRAPLSAEGLMPDALRDRIADALRAQHLLVEPIVDVS